MLIFFPSPKAQTLHCLQQRKYYLFLRHSIKFSEGFKILFTILLTILGLQGQIL